MADTPRHQSWVAELALFALLAAAGSPITRLFRAGGAGGDVLLAIVVSLGVSILSRRVGIPFVLRFVVSLAAFFWFVAARYAPHTLWGPFPSGRSLTFLRVLLHQGSRITMEDAAPVPAAAGVLLFVVAGVWMSAWLVDSAYSLGNPLLAIGAAVPLFLAPGSLVASNRLGLEAVLFLAAAAWVLFSDERAHAFRRAHGVAPKRAARRHPGWAASAAIPVVLAALVVSIVAPPHLPGFGATPYLRAHGPGAHIGFNPIVAIKPTLSQAPNRILMRVRTSSPGYYRLTELDDFDGDVWKARPGRLIAADVAEPPPLAATTKFVRQDYVIDALVGAWLPALYIPVALGGVADATFESDSSALLSNGLHTGLQYTVFSRVPVLTSSQLDGAGAIDANEMRDYLTLPRSTPKKIREIAQQIAGEETTEFRRAFALQSYLRKFTYDQRVAAGHSFRTMVDFLTKSKRGYCEQFAAAMAVLARTLGIPSRVVIGFAHGDAVGDSYIVRTKHAHAWVELYFPGYDWVPFEPTPRSGIVSVPTYAQALPGEIPLPSASASALPQPSATATTGSKRAPDKPEIGAGSSHGLSLPWWGGLLAAFAMVIAAVLIVPFVVRARRRRRAHQAPTARDAVVLRYVDFLAWCNAAGIARGPGETPREHSARIAVGAPGASASLGEVAFMADEALWAPPNGLVLAEFDQATAAARAQIAPVLPRSKRLLAWVLWGR